MALYCGHDVADDQSARATGFLTSSTCGLNMTIFTVESYNVTGELLILTAAMERVNDWRLVWVKHFRMVIISPA